MSSPTRAIRGCGLNTCLVLLAGLFLGLPAHGQQIKVTSVAPDITLQGVQGLPVVIQGDNFAAGATVAFFMTGTRIPGGITVTKVKVIGPGQLDITIDVAGNAQTQTRFDVEVKCNGRTGKGTEMFTVIEKMMDMHSVPPRTINDLKVSSVGFNTAVLTFTAPAYEFRGPYLISVPAVRYDIRVRKASEECGPFTMDIWGDDAATWTSSDPCYVYSERKRAGSGGSIEIVAVKFLSPNSTYWAAVRAADSLSRYPKWSDLPEPADQLRFRTGAFPAAGLSAPWKSQVVDACPVLSTDCSLNVSPRLSFGLDGNPSILYVKQGVPMLASWTGAEWVIEGLPVEVKCVHDFAIDPWSGEPTIATTNCQSSDSLRFHRKTPGGWKTETLATGSLACLTMGFAPQSPIATVAYTHWKSGHWWVALAEQHGYAWVTEDVAPEFSGALANTIAFDKEKNPAVTFSHMAEREVWRLRFAYREGAAWTVEEVEPVLDESWNCVGESSVAFDPVRGDFSVVAGYSNLMLNRRLEYCERATGSWSCETIAEGSELSGIDLAFDGSGTAYLAYRNGSDFFMLVRKRGEPQWAMEYIDYNVWSSYRGDLHIAPNGQPAITYGSPNGWTGAGGSDGNYAFSFAQRESLGTEPKPQEKERAGSSGTLLPGTAAPPR